MKRRIKIGIGLVVGMVIVFSLVFAITPDNAMKRKTLSNLQYHREQMIEIVCDQAGTIYRQPELWDWDMFAWGTGAYWRCVNDEEITTGDLEQVEGMLNAKIEMEEYSDLWGEVEEATNRDNPNE